MSKSSQAFRTIREVSDWLDVKAHVLRFWESKFPQIKPVKRAGGRRYYRPADMELVGGIKVLLHEQGMTIKGVQNLIRDEGVSHVMALSPSIDINDDAPEEEIQAWDQALSDDDGRSAARENVEDAEVLSAGDPEAAPEEVAMPAEPEAAGEPQINEAVEAVALPTTPAPVAADTTEPQLPFGLDEVPAPAKTEPEPALILDEPDSGSGGGDDPSGAADVMDAAPDEARDETPAEATDGNVENEAPAPAPEAPAMDAPPAPAPTAAELAPPPADEPDMAQLMRDFAEITARVPTLGPDQNAKIAPLLDRAADLATRMTA